MGIIPDLFWTHRHSSIWELIHLFMDVQSLPTAPSQKPQPVPGGPTSCLATSNWTNRPVWSVWYGPKRPAGPIRFSCLLEYVLKRQKEFAGNCGHRAKRSWSVGAGVHENECESCGRGHPGDSEGTIRHTRKRGRGTGA